MTFNTNPNCTELIKSGKCKADCCGCVPIPERYWQRLKKLVRDKEYKQMPFTTPNGQKWVAAVSKDLKCVFLDSECKCLIYKSPMKPPICNQYGLNSTETLLACPHINEDKKQLISDCADKKMDALRRISA